GGPQLEDPLVRGVVRLPIPDGAHPGVRRDGWCGEVRLSRAQVEHVLARRLTALRLLRDRDGRGGLEVLQVGREAGSRGHARDDSPAGQGGQPRFYSQAEAWARYDAALKGSALSGQPLRVGTTGHRRCLSPGYTIPSCRWLAL